MCFNFRRRRLFGGNNRQSPPGRASSKCSVTSHREPSCLTHLRDDCDGEPDNLENYIKHCQLQQQQQQQQQQCLYRAVLHADSESPYAHTCEHPLPLLATSEAPDVTDVSRLAGIHRSHSFSSSAYASRGDLCSVQDCNRPSCESVPMVECTVPRTLMRTNSGKSGGARKPIPVDTPRYFVLEQQPS